MTVYHFYAVGDGATGPIPPRTLAANIPSVASGNLDAFLYLGDVYSDGTTGQMVSEYDTVYGAQAAANGGKDLRTRTLATPGNHEHHTSIAADPEQVGTVAAEVAFGWREYWRGNLGTTTNGIQPWPGSFTTVNANLSYSKVIGPIKFIMFDTNVGSWTERSSTAMGTTGSAYAWLSGQLNDGTATKKILVSHQPRWNRATSHPDGTNPTSTTDELVKYDPIWELFVDNGGLVWISGHSHVSNRHVNRNRDGNKSTGVIGDGSTVLQIVSGAGGTGLYTNKTTYLTPNGLDNGTVYAQDTALQYLQFDVDDVANTITFWFRDTTGASQHTWTETMPAAGGGGAGQPRFLRDTGVALSGTEWGRLDEWPPDGTGIKQAIANATDHVLVDVADSLDTTDPGRVNGVTVVAAFHSDAAGGNSASIKAKDPSQEVDIYTGTMGGTAQRYFSKGITRITTGETWNRGLANSVQIEFGYAPDVTPAPILDSLMLEIAIKSATVGGEAFQGAAALGGRGTLTGAAAVAVTAASGEMSGVGTLVGKIADQKTGKKTRRVQRGLGYVVHQIETDDDTVTLPIMGEWEASEEAPGGVMSAAGTIPEQDLFDSPLAIRWGATYRAMLAEDGFQLFGGKLLQPGHEAGAALLAARGWGSIYGERQAGRVLALTYDMDEWFQMDEAPLKLKMHKNYQLTKSGGKLQFQWDSADIGSAASPNDAGFAIAVRDGSITRLAFRFEKSDDNNDYELQIDKVMNLETPNASRGTVQTYSLAAGGLVDGATVECIPGNPPPCLLITIRRKNTAATTGKMEITLTDVRVNGIGRDDNVAASSAVESVLATMGLTRGDIVRNETNIAPYDGESGPLGEHLDYFSMLSGWPWLIFEQLGPFFDYSPWEERTWELSDQTEVRPVELERFSAVRIPFRRNSGGKDQRTIVADPNPLGYVNTFTDVEFEERLPDRSHAAEIAIRLLEELLPPRYGGTARLAEVRGLDGFLYSAHHVRVGDTLIVPWLDLPTYSGPPSFRIEKLRRTAEAVEVTFQENPTGLERILRRRGRRLHSS